jgi:hypothetical protein
MSERRIIEISVEASLALGFVAVVILLIASIFWYNLVELTAKREALARGTPALEIQCLFASERERAACLVLLGARK